MICFFEMLTDKQKKIALILGTTGGISGATSAAYLRKKIRDNKPRTKKDIIKDIGYTVAGAIPIAGGIANYKSIKAINGKQ